MTFSSPPKMKVSSSRVFALAPLLCVASAFCTPPPASALITYGLDSTTGNTSPPVSFTPPGSGTLGQSTSFASAASRRQVMTVVKMGSLDAYLDVLRTAYMTSYGSGTADFRVDVYKPFLDSTLPTPTYKFSGASLASATSSLAAANTLPAYTPDLATTGSTLSSYLFQADQTYGFVFSIIPTSPATTTTRSITLRNCATVAPNSPSTCVNPALAYGGVAYVDGTAVTGISLATPTWTDLTPQQGSFYMQIDFTPVPIPALSGLSSLSGLLFASRRLRSRIKAKAA
jgi:hypothetical protein